MFQVLKTISSSPNYCTHQGYLSYNGERITFHDESRLKEFMTTKSALQNIVKEILQTEEIDEHIQEATEEKKV